MRLETDGAAIVRGFLSHRQFSRIAEIVGNAFAFIDAGGGDAALRENWIKVGTLWLTNLEHCVAPKLAGELVTRRIAGLEFRRDAIRRREMFGDPFVSPSKPRTERSAPQDRIFGLGRTADGQGDPYGADALPLLGRGT